MCRKRESHLDLIESHYLRMRRLKYAQNYFWKLARTFAQKFHANDTIQKSHEYEYFLPDLKK